MSRKRIIELAARLNLGCDTWSPGDGVTRYRFSRRGDKHEYIYTALGAKDAESFLAGVKVGRAPLYAVRESAEMSDWDGVVAVLDQHNVKNEG